MGVVFDYVKHKHIGNDAPMRSFYKLYWMLVALKVASGNEVVWVKDFKGRIMLSRIYIKEIEVKYGKS